MRRLAVALATAACALASARGPARDPAQDAAQDPPREEEPLEKFLRLATTGSPVVRPQAAQRLLELGAEAVERLVAECGQGPAEMGALGRDLIEVLGEFGDARLRARLAAALDDRDFPWRPAAARSLAKTALAGERPHFATLLDDPLAAVRAAAIDGLERLDARDELERVRRHLSDPDDRVRRAAASLSFAWGDGCALAWVLEELKRDDQFFEQQNGKLARYRALAILRERLGEELPYRAEKPCDDAINAEAFAALARRCAELCGGELPELPPIARAGRASEGDVLGLELRSCRRGEYYLRWNAADALYVGLGNPVRVELAAGTVAKLLAEAELRVAELGQGRLWGEPGCDVEQFHLRPSGAGRSSSFVVSKGQAFVAGLRPGPLGKLARAMLATLPEDGDDPRLEDLRARVESALLAIGGE